MSTGQLWRGVLTERQAEVAEQIAAGRTNKEIGEELFMAESTVKYYVNQILTELRLRNRVLLARWWFENVELPAAIEKACGET
jgi:DNA-binding NarL/FixJ family response regulator